MQHYRFPKTDHSYTEEGITLNVPQIPERFRASFQQLVQRPGCIVHSDCRAPCGSGTDGFNVAWNMCNLGTFCRKESGDLRSCHLLEFNDTVSKLARNDANPDVIHNHAHRDTVTSWMFQDMCVTPGARRNFSVVLGSSVQNSAGLRALRYLCANYLGPLGD
jgi:hypothetical protein